jgi:type I restriction enzyme S subunit
MSSEKKNNAMKKEGKTALMPKLRFSEFRDVGAWKTETLGSVAKISTAKVGDKACIPMSITSGVGLVSQMEKFGRIIAGSSYANYLQLKKNDFAYNKSATKEYPEGFIALYSGDELAAVPNSIFTCFRVTGDSPVPQYLNYLFLGNLHGRWLRKFIEVGARAHGSLSINEDDLLALPVPLPSGKTSVREQQKIAECLSSVDELIAAQTRKVDALKTHKKGLMQQLFPRDGETVPRLRFPEFREAEGWEEKKLGTVCEIQRGKFSHRPRNDPRFFGGPYPFIQTGDVVKSEGGAVVASQSLNEEGLAVSKLFKPTIVLITIAANIGDTGLLQTEGCFTDSVVGLIPKKNVIPVFLELIMRGQKENLNKVATTGAQKNINNEILREVSVLLPSVPEQQRIASCLSSLDALITAETQKLEALKTHKKGLMQQLFPSPEEIDA